MGVNTYACPNLPSTMLIKWAPERNYNSWRPYISNLQIQWITRVMFISCCVWLWLVWIVFTYIIQGYFTDNGAIMRCPSRNNIESLQWHHNESHGVSDHRSLDCLLNRLFRHKPKKLSKLHVTGLCKSPVTRKMFHFEDVIMWHEKINYINPWKVII